MGGGGIAPGSQRNVKNGCFSFPCNDVDSESCWGGGVWGYAPRFFFIKMVQAGAI